MAEKIIYTIIDGLVMFLIVAALAGYIFAAVEPDPVDPEHDRYGYCQRFPCFTEEHRAWVSLKYMTRGR